MAKTKRPLPSLIDFLGPPIEERLLRVIRGEVTLVVVRAGSTPYWGVFIRLSDGSLEHVYGKFYIGVSYESAPKEKAEGAYGVIRTMVLPMLVEKHEVKR